MELAIYYRSHARPILGASAFHEPPPVFLTRRLEHANHAFRPLAELLILAELAREVFDCCHFPLDDEEKLPLLEREANLAHGVLVVREMFLVDLLPLLLLLRELVRLELVPDLVADVCGLGCCAAAAAAAAALSSLSHESSELVPTERFVACVHERELVAIVASQRFGIGVGHRLRMILLLLPHRSFAFHELINHVVDRLVPPTLRSLPIHLMNDAVNLRHDAPGVTLGVLLLLGEGVAHDAQHKVEHEEDQDDGDDEKDDEVSNGVCRSLQAVVVPHLNLRIPVSCDDVLKVVLNNLVDV
mmetsp:Transcript_5001/g.17362  ORF Transcript_5001/g.17362 Transcript_5001/m.17362 type:complete len:301 (-) Transcript_5001:1859-2761(-)